MRADQLRPRPGDGSMEQDTSTPVQLVFEGMDDVVNPIDTKPLRSKESRRWRRAGRYILGAIGLATFSVATSIAVSYTGWVIAEESGANCPEVPEQTEPEIDNDLEGARQAVANTEFGIEKSTYEGLKVKLDAATSVDEVKAVVQESMKPFSMNVFFGEIPDVKLGFISLPNSQMTHRPELLTLEEAKTSSDEFLQGLSKIPASFLYELEGTDLYFTHTPKNDPSDEDGKGGFHVDNWKSDGRSIILNTASEGVGENFIHEALGHGIHKVLCGTTGNMQGKGDSDFIGLNQGWVYDSDPTLKAAAKKAGITVTEYGAGSYTEDVADTSESLIKGGYKSTQYLYPSPATDKQELMVQRLSLIEPNFEQYAMYMTYIGNQPFPREYARAGSFTAECFGSYVLGEPPVMGVEYETVRIEINKNALFDKSTAGSYEVYRQVEPSTDGPEPDIYKIGWDATPNEYDELERQSLIGSSILHYQRTTNEAPAYQVDFEMLHGNPITFGSRTINCHTFIASPLPVTTE